MFHIERDNKLREYLGITRKKDKAIDTYGARYFLLKEEFEQNWLSTTPAELRNRFMMGMGPEITKVFLLLVFPT